MSIRAQNEEAMKRFKFGTFDYKEIPIGKGIAVTITAKRNCGKSVLMKDLCYRLKDLFQRVYVFSNTAKYQPEVFDFVNKEDIFVGLDSNKLKQIWATQDLFVEKLLLKNKGKKIDHKKVDKILILFDDLIGDPGVRTEESLIQLFTRGRHCYISQIFITQTIVGIPPVMRRNLDLAISFYLENYDCRKTFSMEYLSTKNVQLGMRIFEELTAGKGEHQCIIKLNYGVSKNPEDFIRTYKAELKLPKFHIGPQDFRLRHTADTTMFERRVVNPSGNIFN